MASSPALRFLLPCAKAIEDGNLRIADWLLHRIINVADKEPDKHQSRVVKLFAEALVRRAYGLHPPSSYTLPLDLERFYYRDYCYYYSCYHDSFDISGIMRDTIKNALPWKGKKRFHLIDIPLRQFELGETVLSRVPDSNDDPIPTSVRVSLFLPPFLKGYGYVDYEKECFDEEAKKLNIKLELEDGVKVVWASGLREVDDFNFKTRDDQDETTVVFYNLQLNRLLKDTAADAMKRELVRLREINPALVFILDFYANHDDDQFNFFTYLEDSFHFYSGIDGDLWETIEFVNNWLCSAQTSEGEDLNPIRRRKTLTEWKHIFLMAGFRQVPLSYSTDTLIPEIMMREENECLVLGRKKIPMLFLSAWKPVVENQHFNCNPTSHKFGPDFDSRLSALLDTKIPPLQPLLPFPQGLVLNQLAAFVEIRDILKDLCHKYDIPVALTWASRINDKNEKMSCPYKNHGLFIQSDFDYREVWDLSYPYKNHTLLIQSNSCYVKDEESYDFMEAYAQAIHIKASQSIAVKALESSDGFHFEPSIQSVCVGDDEFLAETEDDDIDAAAAICLQNCYTNNEVYVVEFFWERGKPEDLAFVIIDELKSRKKKFVTVRVPDTGVGFQEKAISNILPPEEVRDVDAVEINKVNDQREAIPNVQSTTLVQSSSHVAIPPFNTPERSHGQVKSKKTKREPSWIWNHFNKIGSGEETRARCNYCSKFFKASSKNGTSNLHNHFNTCKDRQLKYPVDTEKSPTFDRERSHLDFVKLIIKHPSLFDIVDQELFKEFVKGVQPMFEFQSKDSWLSDIQRMYKEEKDKLRLYFDRIPCKLNITVNLWKNSPGKTTYCCLIAHFIDDDWELKTKILTLKPLQHIHDTKALGEIIQRSIAEWNIGKKVCSITVDNSALDDDMVQQIKETCLSDQDSLSSAHWFICCTLLEDSLREIDDIILKLRKSIDYVSGTTHGKLKFQEAVDKMKQQDGKSWNDVSFRLDSDFDILDSALGSREIFRQLEKIDGNFKLNPSMEEWEKAVALHNCLKCFDDVKGTKSLTEDFYFPKLCNIYKSFLQLEKRNHPIITLMKSKFDHYWSSCNLALAIATVLDPRLKFEFVQTSYNMIYGHDSNMQLNRFRKVLTEVYDGYANDAKNMTESVSDLDGSNSSTTETESVCILDFFRKSVSANEVASWKSELDRYLEEPLLPLDGAFFNILSWWCFKSQTFPILGRIARDLLAMPISFFAPCSDFLAMITNPAYNSLNPKGMETFVCCQNWLEIPKENDGENYEPLRNTEKRKRKMYEDTNVVKVSKTMNHEKANITGDIVKDSNKNDGSPSFDNWLVPQCSSKFVNEKTKIVEASNVHQELSLLQSSSISKPNYGRDISGVFEIPDDDTSFDHNLSEMSQSSSSESDDETPLKQQGSWCKEDVREYLISDVTDKEYKRLDKWKMNELNGKLIGRVEEFRLTGDKLAPLLLMPHGNESRQEYYIDDSVVNAFFQLVKKRYDRFPKAYINHYSFDSGVATYLIEGTKLEHEVLDWFKEKKPGDAQRLFLPLCISAHWVLFYVDTKEKKFSCLDSNPSKIIAYSLEIRKILQWFRSFLLPVFGYNDANVWPFVVRYDIPVQKNLVDCGIFVMKYGDCLTHGDFFPFTQEDMIHFRHRIFLDICHGRLYSKKIDPIMSWLDKL